MREGGPERRQASVSTGRESGRKRRKLFQSGKASGRHKAPLGHGVMVSIALCREGGLKSGNQSRTRQPPQRARHSSIGRSIGHATDANRYVIRSRQVTDLAALGSSGTRPIQIDEDLDL
jgi:hypothetical protein